MSWHDSDHWQSENSARLRLVTNDWTPKAACRGANTEIFYPQRGDSELPAKQVCRGCQVKTECLTYALASAEKIGVWGQSSERQRRLLRQAIRSETEQGIDRDEAIRNTVKRFFKGFTRPNRKPNTPETVTDTVQTPTNSETVLEPQNGTQNTPEANIAIMTKQARLKRTPKHRWRVRNTTQSIGTHRAQETLSKAVK